MYVFRAICKYEQFRNCVAQLENFEIACVPISKLPADFQIATQFRIAKRNFEIA